MKRKIFTCQFHTAIVLLILIFYSGHSSARCSKLQNPDSSKSLESEYSQLVKETFEELKVPGAIIGIWEGKKEPYITTLGVSDLSANTPISLNDKMRIGSITKTFTGTVLLQLADEGKIKLLDKLSKYFPDYPSGDNITIEELGNMTSGIFNYTEDENFQKKFFGDMSVSFTPEELIDIAKKHPPYFPPGTSIHYSNSNTILLGLIIEKITGNKLQDEISKRIIIPLKMTNTSFAADSFFPEPHSKGYIYFDSTDLIPKDVTLLNPSWGWAAGAIISTLDDLSKYAKPLATGNLLNPETQKEREKWVTIPKFPSGAWKDEEMKYGFALASFAGALGHNGGIPGFNSFLGYVPGKDISIIILVNMQDNKEGIGPADYLARKILDKINQNKN